MTAKPKFPLGKILATPAALKAIADAAKVPPSSLTNIRCLIGARSVRAMPRLNDEALVDGSRLLSACCLPALLPQSFQRFLPPLTPRCRRLRAFPGPVRRRSRKEHRGRHFLVAATHS